MKSVLVARERKTVVISFIYRFKTTINFKSQKNKKTPIYGVIANVISAIGIKTNRKYFLQQ